MNITDWKIAAFKVCLSVSLYYLVSYLDYTPIVKRLLQGAAAVCFVLSLFVLLIILFPEKL